MKELPINGDKLSISLSAFCAFHCLALPLIIVFLPATLGSTLQSESFHLWMIIAVIPISLYSLTLGCKKHSNYAFLAYGIAGLTFLISALVLEEILASEAIEKLLTIIGVLFISYSHYQNFKLCRKKDCKCPSK